MANLTAKEARTKWCPYTRVALKEGMAANRTGAKDAGLDPSGDDYGNVYEETRCLADGCMMWTWIGASTTADREGRCGLITSTDLES